MANKKISELPESTANITDNDLLAVAKAQGGGLFVSNKITGQTLRNTFNALYVRKTGDTMTGELTVKMPVGFSSVINMGNTDGPTHAFIDFHSSGENNDFDSRIIAVQGTGTATAQQGLLQIRAGVIQIVGTLIANDVAQLIEPGGGLETNTAGDKIKVQSGDSSFVFSVDATGNDTDPRVFTKVGNVTTATPPFLTMEGVSLYVDAEIFGSVPITINLTSNIFNGKLAGGMPEGVSPSPVNFSTRTAITVINGNGFTVTGLFRNAFSVEIGLEFASLGLFRMIDVNFIFNDCQNNVSAIRLNQGGFQPRGISIQCNGTKIDSFVNCINSGLIQTIAGSPYAFKFGATLSSGAENIFVVTDAKLSLANASQNPSLDFQHQIVFTGVPWKFNTFMTARTAGNNSIIGSPITREVSYFGTLNKISSATAPDVINLSLNSISGLGLTYTNSGGTGGLDAVYPGDAIILATGGQSNPVSLAGANKTGTVAHALPVILT